MTFRTGLVLANLSAWLVFVWAREPMGREYFTRHDKWRDGVMDMWSSDPPLVLAGRPLWYWSEYHGGESLPVKVLEVANGVPLVLMVVADLVVGVFPISTLARSKVTFAGVLVLTSGQWWAVGCGLSALHRRLRRK